MNRKITLTTKEKIMNMAEPGIVSAAGNYFSTLGNPRKQRAGGLMRYTLCVFQDKARRNGSRYGFAFYIPAISGIPFGRPLSTGRKFGKLIWLASKVAALVPLQLILIFESDGCRDKASRSLNLLIYAHNSLQTRSATGYYRFVVAENNSF